MVEPLTCLNTVSLAAFGVHFRICGNDRELLSDALEYLPHGWQRSDPAEFECLYSLVASGGRAPSDGPAYDLYRDGRRIFRSDDRSLLLERFGSVSALHVANASRDKIFVHAGVVGWNDRAILIPGRSFSGKTTLVAALVRAGATYYSDEYAVIDRQGMVHPYAQPLQIRENGCVRQTQYPVEQLGGISGHQPLPAGLVIFCRYREGARWHPRQLSAGLGCLEMLNNTVSARSAPALALGTLKQVALKSLIVRGVRGEVPQLIEWITASYKPVTSA
jgi:hypothetical protein